MVLYGTGKLERYPPEESIGTEGGSEKGAPSGSLDRNEGGNIEGCPLRE